MAGPVAGKENHLLFKRFEQSGARMVQRSQAGFKGDRPKGGGGGHMPGLQQRILQIADERRLSYASGERYFLLAGARGSFIYTQSLGRIRTPGSCPGAPDRAAQWQEALIHRHFFRGGLVTILDVFAYDAAGRIIYERTEILRRMQGDI